jgi:phosphohistidine swiveling domain-containing protein
MRLAASGAAATDVDPAALLRQMQALQAQVDALTAAKVQDKAPEVVRYATALADHLQAKADAHPTINADPDHTFIPALHKVAQLVNAAEGVVAHSTGHDHVITLAKDVGAWVSAHARKFPAIDYDYLLQLAEEAAGAAAKLLA